MPRLAIALFASSALFVACNVDPPAQTNCKLDLSEPPTKCPSALVIGLSDYQSTNIALAALDGTTLFGSCVSSAAATPKLSLALSGDVALPSEAPESREVVLIDRFGTNVITWLDPASGKVRAQLPVGTGFEANAQDYLEIGSDLALVSRFGKNPTPGMQAFDSGGDLLLIDTRTPAIVASVALAEEVPSLSASPSAITRLGEQVVVGLNRISADFSTMGNARFMALSSQTRQPIWTLELDGIKNCGKLTLSPSGKLAAVSCTGQYDSTSFTYPAAASDIVLLDVTQQPPREVRRLKLGQTLGVALQPNLAFASEQLVVVTTYGDVAAPGDRLVAVDLQTDAVATLAQASTSYVFGGIHCTAGCGNHCLLADAERAVLRRYEVVDATSLAELEAVSVETDIGLPPRQIGVLK